MESTKTHPKLIIHTIIGLTIMFGFRFLPISLTGITPLGLNIIGIFIGMLYLWSTVDSLWPSLLGVILVGFSGYAPAGKVAAALLGNATAIQLIFMMVFTGGLLYYGVTKYIVRFCLTLKWVSGRPWAITSLLMATCYFISAFIGPFAGIFLFFSIMAEVFEEVGYKKGDTYVTMTLVMVMILSCIGSATMPFRGSILAIVDSYKNITAGAQVINESMYFIFALLIGIVLLITLLLVAKFIIKPDVEPLKEFNIEVLHRNPLPPMSNSQKYILGAFFALLLYLLIPPLFPHIPIMKTLNSATAFGPMIMVVILSIIRENNQPVFDLTQVVTKNFSWSTYFLSVTAIFFGTVLTADSVGLKVFLESIFAPTFSVITPTMFAVFVIALSVLLTNTANSIVMGLLLLPLVYTYSVTNGMSSLGIVTLLTFSVNATAALTPAASAYSAILFGHQKWINPKHIYKYATIFILSQVLIIICIGIPLSNIMFK